MAYRLSTDISLSWSERYSLTGGETPPLQENRWIFYTQQLELRSYLQQLPDYQSGSK